MRYFKILFLITALLCGEIAKGESIAELRLLIEKAEKEIKTNTELLEKNLKNQTATRSQLKLLGQRIDARERILSSLKKETNLLVRDITQKNDEIERKTEELNKIKSEYAKLVRKTYLNYRMSDMNLLLFAAKDFNQMNRRIALSRREGTQRQEKGREIDSITLAIGKEVEQLNIRKGELEVTKQKQEAELSLLNKDEAEQQKMADALKTSERRYAYVVQEKQRQIDAAHRRIEQLIAEEQRKQQVAKSGKSEEELEQIKILTGRFDENRGKLPMPVRKGVIIDKFGRQNDPTNPGIIKDNKGVNIATEKGAAVRAVFDGEVTNISFLNGLNNIVMLRHGDYLTIYANLASLNVKFGEKVKIGDTIGNVSSGDDADEYTLHFEVWKGTTPENPSLWFEK